MQVLHDRRLQAGFVELRDVVDLDVSQAFRAIDADEPGVLVDLAARERAAARHAQRRDAAVFGIGHAGEHLERDILDRIGDFGQLQRHAQVRLVRTVARHRFRMGHARERIGQFHIQRFLEHGAYHLFHQRGDLRLVQERSLDIHLGEFGLAVGAQVFVAKTLGDLVIAIEACHHQQLLEQLRRLRQREEFARMHARRHQIIARAFRRGLGQHWGFDVDEAAAVEETAERHRHLVAQHHVLLHLRTAQVDHAVGQAHRLGQVLVVQLERRSQRGIQHLDLMAQYLDLAAGDVGIGRACRTMAHLAGDAQHEFAAHRLGDLEHPGAIRIADDLRQPLAVTQVDEDHPAVVAAAMRPSAQADGLVELIGVKQSTIMSSHGSVSGEKYKVSLIVGRG